MATDIISSIRIDAGSNILTNTLASGGNFAYDNPPLTGTHTIYVTIGDASEYEFMFIQQTRSATIIQSAYFAHGTDGTEDTAMSGATFVNGDVLEFRAANLFLFPVYYTVTGGTLGGGCTLSGTILERANPATNDATYATASITANIQFVSNTGATGTAQVTFNPTDTLQNIPDVVMTGGGGGTCTSFTGEVVTLVLN